MIRTMTSAVLRCNLKEIGGKLLCVCAWVDSLCNEGVYLCTGELAGEQSSFAIFPPGWPEFSSLSLFFFLVIAVLQFGWCGAR